MGGNARARTADDRLLSRRKRACIDILDSTTEVADEVVMVTTEGVRQFITGKSLMELQPANDAQIAQQLNRAVDRNAIDRAVIEAGVNLFDAERYLGTKEHVCHGASGLSQAIASLFEQSV
jgi:hypothetical protein